MLRSAVLQLQADDHGTIQGATGRAVHGFWFDQWQHSDPATGDWLHQDNGTKPFTLSPLMGLPRPQHGCTSITPGQTASIRITTLSPRVSTAFLENWVPLLRQRITLANTPWHIHHIGLSTADHFAASVSTYADLAQQGQAAATRWTLSFETPTTFRTGTDTLLPFPLPGMLIKSWQRRWEAFSGIALPPFDEEMLRERLHITAYRLKTVPVRYAKSVQIGCVGSITFSGQHLPPDVRAAIDTLVAYAPYCGTGKHTTRGMGQTYRQGAGQSKQSGNNGVAPFAP